MVRKDKNTQKCKVATKMIDRYGRPRLRLRSGWIKSQDWGRLTLLLRLRSLGLLMTEVEGTALITKASFMRLRHQFCSWAMTLISSKWGLW